MTLLCVPLAACEDGLRSAATYCCNKPARQVRRDDHDQRAGRLVLEASLGVPFTQHVGLASLSPLEYHSGDGLLPRT